MTHQVEWTAEERQRASAVLEDYARSVNNGAVSCEDTVPADTCRYWRERIREWGELPERVDGRGFAEATIRKHASGECTHEDTGKPVEYVGGEWVAVDADA